MTENETLEERSQRIFGESLETVIPQLIHEGLPIQKIANRLEAYPNAIRYWLKRHNLKYNSDRVVSLERLDQS